jgi:hypothetical protein
MVKAIVKGNSPAEVTVTYGNGLFVAVAEQRHAPARSAGTSADRGKRRRLLGHS